MRGSRSKRPGMAEFPRYCVRCKYALSIWCALWQLNYVVSPFQDGELVKENSNKATIRVAPVTGDVIDTLDILAKATNFTYTVTVQRDKEYGKKLPNGKWTGMIGALVDDVSAKIGWDFALCRDQ